MSARVVAKLVLKLILCQRRLTQPIKVEDSYIKKIKVTCLQNPFRKNSCSLENLSLLKMDVFYMDLKFLVVLFTCIGLVSCRCESGEVTVSRYPMPPFPKREIIKFKQPFMDRPAVMYGIKMIDSAYNKNTRADVKLLWVRPEAFSILMRSAYDSHLYGLGVSWMACL
ncbi:uncharacterized protein LOC128191710 [Crassostrea angulata]|uniref:uncharacterized protein LOC128191710 n=1 Tax=Magallana angulata TaxID=2784310 RepID=UPI0022B19E3F|nr:uncharacterized protein LOC128191710 [Crassostrea angulata]